MERPTERPRTDDRAHRAHKPPRPVSSSHGGKDEPKMIGQWRIGRTIGKGSSGRVKIAKHSVTGKYAAIKIVPKGLILNSRMSMSEAGARADKVLLGIEREIVIMKLIDHPNVLNLYDVWETSGELFLIMEYVPGGELFDYLVKRGRLPETEALHYFQQIIHAVDYCHRFNICHRDLKPENLLLDKDKNIKVADFGMAAWQAGERMLETSCGSPHYASPEIVAGKSYHGSASDIWSCGIILFALITGRLPFDDDNIRVLLLKVKTGIFEMPAEVQGPVRDLLYRMLEKDPEQRITMAEILTHPFFVSQPPHEIPGRPLVPPPALNEVERPVESAAEIDPDIMSNLKTLWHGASEDDIIAALLSADKTWEKAIYHLLIKYRNRHLENYDASNDAHASTSRKTKQESEKSESQVPRKALNETSQSKNAVNRSSAAEATPRPQAPTPTKAQGTHRGDAMGPTVQERLAKLNLRPVPQGPRPPITPRNSQKIQSTPGGDVLETRVENNNENSSSFAPVELGTVIQAPSVDDTEVQKFFREVALQLNSMSARSSVASESSQRPGPRPTKARQGSSEAADTSRFADAEDDESDLLMPFSPVTDADTFSVRSDALVMTPAITQEPWTPNLYETLQAEVTRRPSLRSAATSTRRHSGRWAEQQEEAPPPMVSQRMAPPPPRPQPASIPRDTSYVYIELDEDLKGYEGSGSRNSRVAPSVNSRWSEKKKALSIRPVPFGAKSLVESSDSPKRSWFQNLFNFKPAPYTLWSYESVAMTSRVLQQRLNQLGVRVAADKFQDQIVLRCKLATSLDAASKAVYFKVEVMHAMRPSNYETGASFTLVKGAHSAFKEICESVRQDYRLDRLI